MAKLYMYSDLNSGLKVGSDGRFKLETNEAAINQSIKTILSTSPGERLMDPEFGSSVPSLMFEPITERTAQALQRDVTKALTRWEPRISLQRVDVTANPDGNSIILTIQYRIRATGALGNFSARVVVS